MSDRGEHVATVDVAMVTWNTAQLTPSALRRLRASDTSGVVARVLVHDNASTDGTPDAIRRAVPEAEVEEADENLGFAAGVNRLLARSSARWVLLCNSDAWPEADATAALLASAVARPRAGAVAPRLVRPDGAVEESTHPFPSLRVAVATAVGARRLVQWPHDEEPRRVDWAVGAVLLLRRDAVTDVGAFDERYFMYAEDIDWCWRARRAGWEVWYEPGAVFRHVGNASGSERFGDDRDAETIRNATRFYRRTHGSVRTAAWRALNAAGCARLYAGARLRGDRAAASHWVRHLRAYANE